MVSHTPCQPWVICSQGWINSVPLLLLLIIIVIVIVIWGKRLKSKGNKSKKKSSGKVRSPTLHPLMFTPYKCFSIATVYQKHIQMWDSYQFSRYNCFLFVCLVPLPSCCASPRVKYLALHLYWLTNLVFKGCKCISQACRLQAQAFAMEQCTRLQFITCCIFLPFLGLMPKIL